MSKFIKWAIAIIITVALFMILSSFLEVNDKEFAEYNKYYFNNLQLNEKKIYVKIDKAIKNKEEKAIIKVKSIDNLTETINKVITAYFYDNPECYYVSNEYMITARNFSLLKIATIKLNYLINEDLELISKNKRLEDAVEGILDKCIEEGMTDFEKELAIHDALINHVSYYKYKDINEIPAIKHTAYGALVDKEAVCDGYSKAYKLLLEKVGIDSIIVTGELNKVPHAWNMIKLENEYYHVDATSDKLEEDNNRYAAHSYFNLTDKEILNTHTICRNYIYPDCDRNLYNYYEYKNFTIKYNENLHNRISDIVLSQKDSKILEIKVDGSHTAKDIIDELYDINFNYWRSSGKTKVTYTQIEDVYVFIK